MSAFLAPPKWIASAISIPPWANTPASLCVFRAPAERVISRASRSAPLCCSRTNAGVWWSASITSLRPATVPEIPGAPRRDFHYVRGPHAIITTRGILRFGEDGEAYLASVHPGSNVEEILSNTGWNLARPQNVRGRLPRRSPQELAAIREIDPQGFWTHEHDP